MSETSTRRERMQAHVADARAQLAAIAATHSEADLAALQVTPEWNGLDMLRHIWFWNETARESLQDWAHSQAMENAEDFDSINHVAVQARAHLGRDALLMQLNAVYDRYEQILAHASDDELNEPGIAAWGEHTTRLGLIGVVGHDEEHYEEMLSL